MTASNLVGSPAPKLSAALLIARFSEPCPVLHWLSVGLIAVLLLPVLFSALRSAMSGPSVWLPTLAVIATNQQESSPASRGLQTLCNTSWLLSLCDSAYPAIQC